MSQRPLLAALISLLSVSLPLSCSTGAVAVQECREIENLRCEVSEACGTVDDVAACQRFYDGHCLHGIEGPKKPSADELDRCLDAIDGAGRCAKDDPETKVDDCKRISDPSRVSGARAFADVCDFIGRPWALEDCGFLNPKEKDDGGEGGVGGGK